MRVVVLTGAGISADSGVPTFRDADGLWAKFDWQRLATPEAFAATPDEVHAFYNARRAALKTVAPNPAHLAIAQLEKSLTSGGHDFLLISQNVDDLHRRAGSTQLLQMHGRLDRIRCENCGDRREWLEDLETSTPCPACNTPGGLRPDIVWFGEMPVGQRMIADAMAAVTHFIAIGTSGSVYPAAGLVAEANARGANTTEINLEPSDNASQFNTNIYGRAREAVPQWVDTFLAQAQQ